MEYKWFSIWKDDKESMIVMMERNIMADLDAGYSPIGNAIRTARWELTRYIAEFDEQTKALREMTPKQAEHWCYIDLKRRGVID